MAKKAKERKPVRTSAAQIRDFSSTGFLAIQEIATLALEHCEEKETKSWFTVIAQLAANFEGAIE